MKRQIWISALVAILVPVVVTQSAWAGSKQRHRWEGIAIGLGVAVLGNVLTQAYGGYAQPAYAGCYQPAHRYVPPPVRVYPQTQIFYHNKTIVRTGRPGRHHRNKPWGCEKRHKRHRRHW